MERATDPRLGVLRHRNFALYLTARLLSTVAVQMQSVAIGWQVYAMTGNVFHLGLIGLAQFAPFLLLILYAGHAADRYDRRRIILLCIATQLICAVSLLAFTLLHVAVVWPIFLVLVLFGSARAFVMPASQAMLINMVPPADFSRAVALSSSAFHVAVIAGPVLGGPVVPGRSEDRVWRRCSLAYPVRGTDAAHARDAASPQSRTGKLA